MIAELEIECGRISHRFRLVSIREIGGGAYVTFEVGPAAYAVSIPSPIYAAGARAVAESAARTIGAFLIQIGGELMARSGPGLNLIEIRPVTAALPGGG